MQLIVNICLLLLLAVIVLQDMKERRISWVLLPLLLGSFLAQGLFLIPVGELLRYTIFNISFILLQLLVLTAYMSIKNKKLVNIINSHLGIGDVLFFITATAAFSPVNFIVFYIIGLLLTLIFFTAFSRFVKNVSKEIPLAGAMAAVMIVLLLVNQWMPKFNFYNDDYLTGWFIH